MLIHMADLLQHARRNGYAVGGYDIVSLEFLEAIVAACERDGAPAILSLAESHFHHYDFATLMPAVVEAARRAQVPFAIHLDHGASQDSVIQAIRLGCNGVMVDGSHLPYADNVALTREVVAIAHGCGIPVEAELGYVPGVEGEDAALHPGELRMTEPEEAARFVADTGVDCLAVSVGTVHGRMRGTPVLDFARLAAIRDAVGIPLVIHGGTGLSDEQYRRLVESGMTKLNYYTALADAASASIRAQVEAMPGGGYTQLLAGVRAAIAQEVSRMNALLGASGRAAQVAAQCRPWREVLHAIGFNVAGELPPQAREELLREGVRRLSAIPGVRSVEAGVALRGEARYHYCWNIRFAAPEVVASYANHPIHRDYADRLFRPAAADRLTIDYSLDYHG
ncbi:class II fructose-bisphosphate aldolase [Thiobacter aerophilum]|uniref:Class II fructose-bisphosphate aldolase n=1 Tax=Thiobacter aerophilum TaxID=3121275 RepID=A0ABV0EGN8_9BURK